MIQVQDIYEFVLIIRSHKTISYLTNIFNNKDITIHMYKIKPMMTKYHKANDKAINTYKEKQKIMNYIFSIKIIHIISYHL